MLNNDVKIAEKEVKLDKKINVKGLTDLKNEVKEIKRHRIIRFHKID